MCGPRRNSSKARNAKCSEATWTRSLRWHCAAFLRSAMRPRRRCRTSCCDTCSASQWSRGKEPPGIALKFIARHRVGVAASSVGVAGLCAALVFALLQGREATTQRDAARRELARATAAHDFTVFQLSAAAPGGGKFSVSELLEQSQTFDRETVRWQPADAGRNVATVGVHTCVATLERGNEGLATRP